MRRDDELYYLRDAPLQYRLWINSVDPKSFYAAVKIHYDQWSFSPPVRCLLTWKSFHAAVISLLKRSTMINDHVPPLVRCLLTWKVFHSAVISLLKRSIMIMFPSLTSTVPFDMEPEILPEGAPVPLNDLGDEENNAKGIASWIYSCSPEPKTLAAKMGKSGNIPWRLQVLNIASSMRVELTPFFHSLPGDLFSTPGSVRRIQRWVISSCNLPNYWLLPLLRTFAENSIAWNQQTLEYDLMRDYRSVPGVSWLIRSGPQNKPKKDFLIISPNC